MECDDGKNGGIVKPRDNDLDLSEADFGPACHSDLLKPCVSDRPHPVCETSCKGDGGILSSHANVQSGNMLNGEASVSSSLHHDAIGLPLCTENKLSEGAYQNNILPMPTAVAAAETTSNIEGDIVISSNTLNDDSVMALYVSASNVSDANIYNEQAVSKLHEELDSDIASVKNITCENVDEVEAPNAYYNSGTKTLDITDVECRVEPIQQTVEDTEWTEATQQAAVDGICNISESHHATSASASVGDIQRGESVSDNLAIHSSAVESANVDISDSGVDEVDKTVASSFRVKRSIRMKFDVDTSRCDDELSPDNDSVPSAATVIEPAWMENTDDIRGVDHVERITTDDVGRSTVQVKISSQSDVLALNSGEVFDVECSSKSDTIVSGHETMHINEAIVYSTESMQGETGSTDVVTDYDRIKSSETSLHDDADDATPLFPCNVASVDTVEAGSLPAEDDVGRTYNMPAAHNESVCNVNEETSHTTNIGDVKDVICEDSQHLSVADGSDAQNVESCQKQSHSHQMHTDDDSSPDVINSSVQMNDVSKTVSNHVLAEQLTIGQSDVTVDSVEVQVPYQAVESLSEPCTQHEDVCGQRDGDQQPCVMYDRLMPAGAQSEDEGLEYSVSEEETPAHNVNIDSMTADIDGEERDKLVADTHLETGTQLPEDISVGIHNLPQLLTKRLSNEGQGDAEVVSDKDQDYEEQSDAKAQSEEDAEKWFEERFASCDDFDVDEFVSSAWSAFHANTANLEPAVVNVHSETIDQIQPVDYNDIDSADAWQHMESTVAVANAADESLCRLSSNELPEYENSEIDSAVLSVPTQPNVFSSPGT